MRSLPALTLICAALLMPACSREQAREELPVQTYLQSPGSLEGHTYNLLAVVENQAGADAAGAVLVVSPLSGSIKVPLYVPVTLKKQFQPEQRIIFTLRVERGILHVTDAKKK